MNRECQHTQDTLEYLEYIAMSEKLLQESKRLLWSICICHFHFFCILIIASYSAQSHKNNTRNLVWVCYCRLRNILQPDKDVYQKK